MGRRNTLFKFGGAITQLRTIARIFHVLWPGWIYPQRIRIPRIFHCQVWLPGGWKNVRPIRKQYPPKNIAWYGTMPSLLVLHWTENWQNKTYFFYLPMHCQPLAPAQKMQLRVTAWPLDWELLNWGILATPRIHTLAWGQYHGTCAVHPGSSLKSTGQLLSSSPYHFVSKGWRQSFKRLLECNRQIAVTQKSHMQHLKGTEFARVRSLIFHFWVTSSKHRCPKIKLVGWWKKDA
jgi:hypothetical protein